jgi:hypothetical protein
MTAWESERSFACTLASLRALAASDFLDIIEGIRQDAKRGPLHPEQIKMLKLCARAGFPGAQDLLSKCFEAGVKKRKGFAEIVKETPRQEGEAYIAWVRRIWDQCDKYDTKYPAVITEELLQRYSRSDARKRTNNLPLISVDAVKYFRTDQGKAEEGRQLR